MRDCRICDHPADDHSMHLCLHTLDCLCTGYEEKEPPAEPEFDEEEDEYRW
jgi:hypothetical protein